MVNNRQQGLQKMVVAIADGSDTAIAMWVSGDVISDIVDKQREVFIEEWLVDVDDMPQKGIWVWEGVIAVDKIGYRTIGEWRALNPDEWESVASCNNPWE